MKVAARNNSIVRTKNETAILHNERKSTKLCKAGNYFCLMNTEIKQRY